MKFNESDESQHVHFVINTLIVQSAGIDEHANHDTEVHRPNGHLNEQDKTIFGDLFNETTDDSNFTDESASGSDDSIVTMFLEDGNPFPNPKQWKKEDALSGLVQFALRVRVFILVF